jgi:hypothetical protein
VWVLIIERGISLRPPASIVVVKTRMAR